MVVWQILGLGDQFFKTLNKHWPLFTSYKYFCSQGDLASRTLVLESKRFYLDVKENQRGRFIKIAEISADGRKNQILMTFSTAALFSQNLIQFIDFYHDLEKLDPDNLRQVNSIHSKPNKYYWCLKCRVSWSQRWCIRMTRSTIWISRRMPEEGFSRFLRPSLEAIQDFRSL